MTQSVGGVQDDRLCPPYLKDHVKGQRERDALCYPLQLLAFLLSLCSDM